MIRPVPFFLVWAEDGGEPRHRHATLEGAEQEASRLARLHPGSRFFVLVPYGSVRRVDIERETFDVAEALGDDGIPF